MDAMQIDSITKWDVGHVTLIWSGCCILKKGLTCAVIVKTRGLDHVDLWECTNISSESRKGLVSRLADQALKDWRKPGHGSNWSVSQHTLPVFWAELTKDMVCNAHQNLVPPWLITHVAA